MEEDKSRKKAHHEEKHHEDKHHLEHKKCDSGNCYKIATWSLIAVSVVLLILFIASIITNGFSGSNSNVKELSAEEVKAKALATVNQLVQGQSVEVVSVTEENGIYNIQLNVGGQTFSSYATKDGKLLFPSGINMDETQNGGNTPENTQPAPSNVPKSDKPVVELFVMSHCPFGTQAEKGILPAVKTLDNKIDFKIRFVYYAMHPNAGEVEEQLRQYCIQKEEPTVFLKYLACFLNASDSEGCLESTNVNIAKLDSCYTEADTEFNVIKNLNDQSSWLSGRFPKFEIDAELNTKYGVQGSPTLVINGVQSNAGRDSASYLRAICAAFNNAPSECNTQLSSTQPGPGFGYDSVGSAQAAGCGV